MATIYGARDLSPEGVLDTTQDITLKWVANGSPQTDFQLIIRRVDNNTIVYDSTKITSAVSQHIVTSGTLSTNIALKWMVTTWNGSDSADSSFISIILNNKPTITLSNIIEGQTLTTQDYEFTSTYSQLEGSTIKFFGYRLFDNNGNLIEDTGQLFPFDYPNSKYTFKNMVNGESFKVQSYVAAQNNLSNESAIVGFNISYTNPDTTAEVIATANNSEGIITIDYADIKQVLGTVSGTFSYQPAKFNNGVDLDSGAYLEYTEPINQDDFTLTWYQKISHDYDGKILEIQDDTGTIEFGYGRNINNEGVFYFIDSEGNRQETNYVTPFETNDFLNDPIGNFLTQTIFNMDSNNIGNFMFVQLTKDRAFIRLDSPTESIVINEVIDLKPTSEHDSLRLYGDSLVDHLHVYTKQFTETEMLNQDVNTITNWGVNTDYRATLDNTLGAGNVIIGIPIIGWRIRRRVVGETTGVLIADNLPKTQLQFLDTIATNNTSYIYTVSAITSSGEGLGVDSNSISLDFWGWILTDGIESYHFFADNSTSEISVNKKSYIYETYTDYPIVSHSVGKGQRMSITTKPFECVNNNLVLDLARYNNIKNFINNNKPKILKDSTGDIMMVETLNINKKFMDIIGVQPYDISFDIIQTGDEGAWLTLQAT